MIVKEYRKHINCRAPQNYFDNWYADVWKRLVRTPTIMPSTLTILLQKELNKIDATLMDDPGKPTYKVTFNDPIKYTWFVLKWT